MFMLGSSSECWLAESSDRLAVPVRTSAVDRRGALDYRKGLEAEQRVGRHWKLPHRGFFLQNVLLAVQRKVNQFSSGIGWLFAGWHTRTQQTTPWSMVSARSVTGPAADPVACKEEKKQAVTEDDEDEDEEEREEREEREEEENEERSVMSE
jgi:hypothetical protein